MIDSNLLNLLLPLASIGAIAIIGILLFQRRKNDETDYEKEMKKLRQLLLKGKLDRKTFLQIRDNLRVEDIYADEIQRLDNLLQQKNIDSETHRRMKKILEMNLKERLDKISLKHNYETKQIIAKI
jgi:hypothetical protein